VLPDFTPSSNPDLHALLNTFRTNHLIPSALSRHQQQLIYRTKYAAQLALDPIFATLPNGEEVRLQHIDARKECPSKWSVIRDGIALARTEADWRNLMGVLEGMKDVGAGLRERWCEKWTNAAFRAGYPDVALLALRRVETTGLSLRMPRVLYATFLGIRGSAQDEQGRWGDAERVERAARRAEAVAEMMEHPGHCGRRHAGVEDPRASPFVIGTVAEMVALRARLAGDADGKEREKVRVYAGRLVASLEANRAQLDDTSLYDCDAAWDTERYRQQWLPVWHGLDESQKLLGDQGMPNAAFAKTAKEQITRNLEAAETYIREMDVDPESFVGPKTPEWMAR
ncbi:hypothetical protein LTS18_008624, partial [Coniosporium uncinatum]